MQRPTSVLLLFAAVAATPAVGQESQEQPVVYINQNQIPWDRIDSLTTLLQSRPQWTAKAKELGHILDEKFLIHMHGDEWNVVVITAYPSWTAFANLSPGWRGEVARMVEPDSTRRAAINAGYDWVFAGTMHRDNIYRVPKQ